MNVLSRAQSLVRGYRRAFGLVEPGGVGGVADQVYPMMDVWGRPEWAALREENLAMGWGYQAAGGAGTRSHVQLWNPTTSKRIIVCEGMYTTYATDWYINLYNVALTTNVTANKGARDTRTLIDFTNPDRKTLGEIRTQANAGVLGIARHFRTAAGTVSIPIVLAPGTGVMILPSADNVALYGNFWWYERDLLPGEGTEEIR